MRKYSLMKLKRMLEIQNKLRQIGEAQHTLNMSHEYTENWKKTFPEMYIIRMKEVQEAKKILKNSKSTSATRGKCWSLMPTILFEEQEGYFNKYELCLLGVYKVLREDLFYSKTRALITIKKILEGEKITLKRSYSTSYEKKYVSKSNKNGKVNYGVSIFSLGRYL